jgi:hypothetical protein
VNEHDDIGRELRETRAEPTPEFARELDERAAEWLRERPRRRLPSLRIAIPAVATAAAAAVVLALAVSGDDDDKGSELEVAVVAAQGTVDAVGGGERQSEALPQSEALRESEAAPKAAEGGFASPKSTRVAEDEPVVVRFFFTAPTDGTVELAGREAAVKVPAGAGRLEISTDGLPAGTHKLVISVRSMPPYRHRIEIGG